MRDTELYQNLLRVLAEWFVCDVELDIDELSSIFSLPACVLLAYDEVHSI
jgi:hypothetical protein